MKHQYVMTTNRREDEETPFLGLALLSARNFVLTHDPVFAGRSLVAVAIQDPVGYRQDVIFARDS